MVQVGNIFSQPLQTWHTETITVVSKTPSRPVSVVSEGPNAVASCELCFCQICPTFLIFLKGDEGLESGESGPSPNMGSIACIISLDLVPCGEIGRKKGDQMATMIFWKGAAQKG